MMPRPALRAVGTPRCIERRERVSLGMMQLCPFGLSEQWLLRDCGDRHWRLIAEALGQTGIAFRDAEGHPVYAAFCATELALEAQKSPLLGQEIEITSSLHEVAAHRIGSEHWVHGPDGPLATLRMISCFLRHDGSGSNRKLLRSNLPGLGELPPSTPGLSEQNQIARRHARTIRMQNASGAALLCHTPVPNLDFNAVGLLYFPTFSKIAEIARPSPAPLARRDVVYLGNLDPGEAISVRETETELRLYAKDRPLAVVSTEHGPRPSPLSL